MWVSGNSWRRAGGSRKPAVEAKGAQETDVVWERLSQTRSVCAGPICPLGSVLTPERCRERKEEKSRIRAPHFSVLTSPDRHTPYTYHTVYTHQTHTPHTHHKHKHTTYHTHTQKNTYAPSRPTHTHSRRDKNIK